MRPVLKTFEANTSGGSNPSFSASKFPNIFNINVLGFFIIHIYTIIVRSDIKSIKPYYKPKSSAYPLHQVQGIKTRSRDIVDFRYLETSTINKMKRQLLVLLFVPLIFFGQDCPQFDIINNGNGIPIRADN